MHIFISAGEPSGDLHGANLVRAFKRLRPDIECVGFGGEKMEAAGCQLSDLGEAHKLWTPCCPDSQWSMNGWLAQSYTWNPYRPVDKFNGPVTWTDRANEYQMNELWLGGGRVTKTDGWSESTTVLEASGAGWIARATRSFIER